MFDFFEYLSMGMTIDFVGLLFSYAFDRPTVGFIAGAVGNIVKMVVNFAVQMVFGIPATFILIGIGLASVTHRVFGGLGGIFADLVLARLARAGSDTGLMAHGSNVNRRGKPHHLLTLGTVFGAGTITALFRCIAQNRTG